MTKALIRTAVRWKIPRDLALQVIARDLGCIYCGRTFEPLPFSRTAWTSWEHIVNDGALVNAENIALCCFGCNSSKGTKPLVNWLQSKYCRERGITGRTIAPVARRLSEPVYCLESHANDG